MRIVRGRLSPTKLTKTKGIMPTLTPNPKGPKEPKGPALKTAEPVKEPNLEARLVSELPREGGQYIKATHVYGDNYRINWFSPESRRPVKGIVGAVVDQGVGIKTYWIEKSQFVKAIVAEGNKLVVEDQTRHGINKPKNLLDIIL